jgi:hypothetical protein
MRGKILPIICDWTSSAGGAVTPEQDLTLTIAGAGSAKTGTVYLKVD